MSSEPKIAAHSSHVSSELVPIDSSKAAERGTMIEVTHSKSDPGTWIVRQYKPFLWFRKRTSSTWFNNELQAVAFARALQLHDKTILATD